MLLFNKNKNFLSFLFYLLEGKDTLDCIIIKMLEICHEEILTKDYMVKKN
jgi:hypothetical protein